MERKRERGENKGIARVMWKGGRSGKWWNRWVDVEMGKGNRLGDVERNRRVK